MTSSLQRILRNRQRDAFVGRVAQLDVFKVNLETRDSDIRRYVFAVSGPAGVGKTSLLRRMNTLAEAAGYVTAWTDEAALDIPLVLNAVVNQLSPDEGGFDEFKSRYKAYRIKRNELEADPEAPHGMPALLGRAVATAKSPARLG